MASMEVSQWNLALDVGVSSLVWWTLLAMLGVCCAAAITVACLWYGWQAQVRSILAKQGVPMPPWSLAGTLQGHMAALFQLHLDSDWDTLDTSSPERACFASEGWRGGPPQPSPAHSPRAQVALQPSFSFRSGWRRPMARLRSRLWAQIPACGWPTPWLPTRCWHGTQPSSQSRLW